MRKITHIALAAVLAAMCVLPAAGQSYKKNKVIHDPEPLTFSRKIDLDINSDKKFDPNLHELLRGWNYSDRDDRVDYLFHHDMWGENYIEYDGSFYNLQADRESFNLWIRMRLHYHSPYRLVLEAYDITLFGSKDPVLKLSEKDDKLNRPWLWRVFHNIETVDKERKIAEECFNLVADSLEDFLKDGPPMKLHRVD